jgi:hypothetical protein
MKHSNVSELINIAIDEARKHGYTLAEIDSIDNLHEGELAVKELEVDDLETQLIESWEEQDDIADAYCTELADNIALSHSYLELQEVTEFLNDEMLATREHMAILCSALGLPEFSTIESMTDAVRILSQRSNALAEIQNKGATKTRSKKKVAGKKKATAKKKPKQKKQKKENKKK